jgi:hypothetical protein
VRAAGWATSELARLLDARATEERTGRQLVTETEFEQRKALLVAVYALQGSTP